ncbi:cell wall-binding repeat-containing protein [Herbiconiux sp. 11R-BC]|uniref:cell wall-binding repeat-containing protein n=1 Tax=Herbiconiux sp. 11R-BC TaxID=3111637 RepID=UPI003C03D8F2
MRRFLSAAVAAVVTAMLVVTGASAANADGVPFPPIGPTHFMLGSVDSIEFVRGEGIVINGWVIDANPGSSGILIELQMQWPDGRTGWGASGGSLTLPRQDVGQVFPAYGPNHGFRLAYGMPDDYGPYKICVEANFEVIGCGSVVVPPASITGAFEGVSVDFAAVPPMLRVHGWTSDDRILNDGQYHGSSVDLAVDFTDPANGQHSASTGIAVSYRDRPDVRAAHPDLLGVFGFDDGIWMRGAGTYRICASFRPNLPRSTPAPADLGCKSIVVTAVQLTANPSLSGSTTVGSTLHYTPASWNPSPQTTSIAWFRSNQQNAVALPAGSLDYPITVADVGHTVWASEFATHEGMLGASAAATSTTVTMPGVSTARLAGADRYEVAIGNAQAEFPDPVAGAPVVYVASGTKFPDALSAAPAAAKEGGALLLTLPDRLPANVEAEITRLHPAGIVVVGGPASVGDAVLHRLEALAPTTSIGGADRYEVSRGVIDHAFPGGAAEVFVVTGANYPDALSSGAAAGASGAPVLLVNGSAASADAATRAELVALHTSAVTIVGGPVSVSPAVASSLGATIAVTRLAGDDRFGAAVALNRASFTASDTVFLATGMNYPDGLSVGARAGAAHAPLYLVNGQCVPTDVLADIQNLHATHVVVVGGYDSMGYGLDSLYAC